MDTWGFLLIVIGVGAYLLGHKKQMWWMVLAGVGLGIVIGAVWAMVIVNSVL